MVRADSIKEVLIKPPVPGKLKGAISVPSAASQIQSSNPAISDLRNKSGAALAQVIQPNVQATERERPIQQLVDEQGYVIVRREGMINLALRQLKARNGLGLVNTSDHLARTALSPGDRADAHRLKSLGYFFSGDLEQCQKELLIARSFGGESSRFYFFLEGFQGIDRIRFSQLLESIS